MNSTSDNVTPQFGNASKLSATSDLFEQTLARYDSVEAKQQIVIEWIQSILPNLNLPSKASSEELRDCLIDGTVLLQILNRLGPGSVNEEGGSGLNHSQSSSSENVKKFLSTADQLGIPPFDVVDLEKGSMKTVVNCLSALRAQCGNVGDYSTPSTSTRGGSPQGVVSPRVTSPRFSEERQKVSPDSKFQRASRNPLMTETPTALMHHVGHKFHEVFQLKQGRYADLSSAKISEMMKSNSLDNAPTQSLLSVVNGILDESIDRKNGEIPHRVACLLRKVVQEIERRISTQAEHLRTQNNLFKAREEKFQSRIRVLEALAAGTGEETEITPGQLRQIKSEKSKPEERKKFEEEEVINMMKRKEQYDVEISMLRKELEIVKKTLELEKSKMDEERKLGEEDLIRLMKEKEQTESESDVEISKLQRELEIANNALELEMSKTDDKRKLGDENVIRLMKEKEKEQTESESDVEISKLRRELEIAKRTLELEKSGMDEKRKLGDENLIRLMKEKEQTESESDVEISNLKRELEIAKRTLELEKSEMDEKRKLGDEGVKRLMKEKEQTESEISTLKQEMEVIKKTHELEKSKMDEERKHGGEDALKLTKEKEQMRIELAKLKRELEIAQITHKHEKSKIDERRKLEEEGAIKLEKERDRLNAELSSLKQEFETAKKKHELHCLQMETEAKEVRAELEAKIKELVSLLEDSRRKVKKLDAYSESRQQIWKKKELIFQRFMEFQSGALQDLRLSSDGIKHELLTTQRSHSQEYNSLGLKFKQLADVNENYHLVLTENRKMFNELQDLKGNIRVYCRIRPLNKGQAEKKTTIEHIGENGEVVVANPSKPGKDGCRLFRFNTVYGPNSTQAEVFSDTQPLIRSVLDGYNVCIFAYGQTGSGKTHTMTGPNGATEEEWGVNYRALKDLFNISQKRSSTFMYEVGVQMFEIYNEQLRDLLSNDGAQKRLGIKTMSQSNGLAVPDANMHPVKSTSDVIRLMELGLNNRSVSATALNERSSRSHSVVSIHVRGKDLQTGTSLQGNLHLVDLAGSERVDRSEVTGDRLKEAQHINKSLSALGDVIFALAQKSSHVPYRNSKLTQLLQTSLGGQAKTLMFVQLNPDVSSYSETMSTLKFAERVSGVELGAAKSSKDGRDVRELMEQVQSLKDTIAKKDGEIERLQLLKDLKNAYPGNNGDKQGTGLSKSANSEHSDNHYEVDSHFQPSVEESKQQNRILKQSKSFSELTYQEVHSVDGEISGSDVSDGGFSDSLTEESTNKSERSKVSSRIRSLQKSGQATPTVSSSPRGSPSMKRTVSSSSSSALRPPRRWQ